MIMMSDDITGQPLEAGSLWLCSLGNQVEERVELESGDEKWGRGRKLPQLTNRKGDWTKELQGHHVAESHLNNDDKFLSLHKSHSLGTMVQ